MKILFTVLDGLSERPLAGLGNQTPVQAAQTPNFDILAKNGVCGLMEPVFTGALPTSEEGHFALFGYDPAKYHIKRGFFTAKGAGIDIKPGDVALRGNFCVVDQDLRILDRRAGRLKNPKPLIDALQGIEVEGVRFIVCSAGEHRLGIVMRALPSQLSQKVGRASAQDDFLLSPNITASDPLYADLGDKVRRVEPLDKSKEAAFTAKVLNKFLEHASHILKGQARGPNYVIVRGASFIQELPSFEQRYGLKACCIAGKLLYKQIAKALGMELIEVPGATGLPNTNLKAKFSTAGKVLLAKNAQACDFVFLHIKATDSLAEDGNFRAKKRFIEKVDENLKFVFENPGRDFAENVKNKDFVWVVTADHSTCCDVHRHCKEPIPILISNETRDGVGQFSESACRCGGLGRFSQLQAMKVLCGFAGL